MAPKTGHSPSCVWPSGNGTKGKFWLPGIWSASLHITDTSTDFAPRPLWPKSGRSYRNALTSSGRSLRDMNRHTSCWGGRKRGCSECSIDLRPIKAFGLWNHWISGTKPHFQHTPPRHRSSNRLHRWFQRQACTSDLNTRQFSIHRLEGHFEIAECRISI